MKFLHSPGWGVGRSFQAAGESTVASGSGIGLDAVARMGTRKKAGPLLSWLGFLVLTALLWNHRSDDIAHLRFSSLVRLSFI